MIGDHFSFGVRQVEQADKGAWPLLVTQYSHNDS